MTFINLHAEANRRSAQKARAKLGTLISGIAIGLLIGAFVWFTHDVLDRLDATIAQGAAIYCAPGC